jgi:hypothetical protein
MPSVEVYVCDKVRAAEEVPCGISERIFLGGGCRRLNDQGNLAARSNDWRINESGRHGKAWSKNLLKILSDAHQVVVGARLAGNSADEQVSWPFVNELAKAQGCGSF